MYAPDDYSLKHRVEEVFMTLTMIGKTAKETAQTVGILGSEKKNEGLKAAAAALLEGEVEILTANQEDVIKATAAGMSEGLVDRLELTPSRIEAMADGLLSVASLEDPVGEVLSMKKRPNGLTIGQKRVPLGVVGIIYEARPNVTADAFGLCFKSGNTVILKGGSDALESNKAIVKWLRTGLKNAGLPEDAVQLITDINREVTREFMRLNDYVDVLIPRGGAGLIKAVVENSTVPVIETGTGNCHIFVDETADFDMALDIIFNAKTQRIGVCNACESLVIHRKIADKFLPLLKERLSSKSVEIRADQEACAMVEGFVPANEEDWGCEYLDYILSLKLVNSLEEAIVHINRYNTKHSEAIITSDYANAQRFLNEIDAAAVYVNASTRFTDGYEFGFGAEIGISTQKLHARGPMGLKELTTTKYIIYGNGQVRP
jgi:glutamate-5-semialdehyde dehydrogenase